MADPCSHEGAKVLLVEGKNDCHVILAICKHFNISESFGIFQCGNDVGVLQRADALIPLPATRCIGLVLDADEKAAFDYRWQQIRDVMDTSGYAMPDGPDPAGTILRSAGKPTLGIWIMPDNVRQGRLEDFLMEMAAPAALEQACQCVAAARDRGVTTFRDVHMSKACLHTYLAWQDEPGAAMGMSITSHALKPHTATAQNFAAWLVRLFGTISG